MGTAEIKRNTWQNGALKGHFFFISESSDKLTLKSAREMGLKSLQVVFVLSESTPFHHTMLSTY